MAYVGGMATGSLLRRFWIYQSERFPLLSYAVLVAALVLGGFGYMALVNVEMPSRDFPLAGLAVAWITTLGIFFQLRVADEFKDFAQDARYRPYRAVPRGVIGLRELAGLAFGFAAVQLALNGWWDARLLVPLALVWGYLWLMRQEFFLHDWLTGRPMIYMLSHMVIMALIFVYILYVWLYTAVATTDEAAPAQLMLLPMDLLPGVGWFLLAGYANGIVFEIGRKLRAPEDEEPGVETYSALWGAQRGAMVWWGALAIAGVGSIVALRHTTAGSWFAAFVVLLLAIGFWVAWRYARRVEGRRAKWIDRYSALWVLLLYTGLAGAALVF